MATLTTKRRCPYCGEPFQLGACPIVATNVEGLEFRSVQEFKLSELELPSGTAVEEVLPKTGWPKLADPPNTTRVESAPAPTRRPRLAEAFGPATTEAPPEPGELPPLIEAGRHREDLPARACPHCEYPLPNSIDEREAVVVAVVGVNRVGKTHLLATSLAEAYRRAGLRRIGCEEFVPDDNSSTRFLEDYFKPLYRDKQVLYATQTGDPTVRFRPLVFSARFEGFDAFSVVLHDVAGEVLGDPRQRAKAATFLRAARGVIFVVDPRDIDDVGSRLPRWILESNELGYDQGALLAECLRSGGILQSDRRPVPVAIVVAKADLLPTAVGEVPSFLAPAPADETAEGFAQRIREFSTQVERFLEDHSAHTIIGPAREYQRRMASTARGRLVTYHAVSALGRQPDADERLTGDVEPINALDPLACVLWQMLSR